MKKICVVTGTRAEYGLLYWLLNDLKNHEKFELQIIVTGMHLSPEFGLTYKQIEKDGFLIDEKIEILLSSDSEIGVTKSVGLACIGFADAYQRLQPDLLIVLGDRYEILAAVQSALFMKIPVAHIAGGDTTEGAFDESIRHAITKMSHIHFPTNEIAKKRILQMGENPKYVFNVGSPGIDHLKRTSLLSKKEFEESINFKLRLKNILVTFHPTTLSEDSLVQQQELLKALNTLPENEYGIIITMPNSDTGGRELIEQLELFSRGKKNISMHTSLGQVRYLSSLKYVDMMVGNSSSGLYEAPTFKIPTINIGDRQKGRLKSSSIIDVRPEMNSIKDAIKTAEKMNCNDVVNPYGCGGTTEKIIYKLEQIKNYKKLLTKQFYERG